MNDPACPLRDNQRHVCQDKMGQTWDRPGSGPRPGTHCDLVNADLAFALATTIGELESPEVVALTSFEDSPIDWDFS